MAGYNQKFEQYITKLDKCIEDDVISDNTTKVTDIIYWFTFDAMGDFILSMPFGMLDSRAWNEIIKKVQKGLCLLGPLSPVPWLLNLGLRFGPRLGFIRDWHNLESWCEMLIHQRLRSKSSTSTTDLAYFLMEREGNFTSDERAQWIKGDALLAIVVGR
jgi:tryprostatin B 6-hydroxylase